MMKFFLIRLLTFFSAVAIATSKVEVTHLHSTSDTHNSTQLHCFSSEIRLEELETESVRFNCSQFVTFEQFNVFLDNERVAAVISADENSSPAGTVFVKGLFLGHSRLSISPLNNSTNVNSSALTVDVVVMRKKSVLDALFIVCVTIMMAMSYVGMGCAIDLQVVVAVLKRPVAPCIGFCCQYLIMPLTAYTAAYLLGLTGSIGLGFFASGCAPGGGASNMYAYLLGGDASLSITMTVVSTLAALGMFPLWIYSLGTTIEGVGGTRYNIPFFNIVISLATMIIPLAIGACIKVKRPSWAAILLRLLRPFFILVIIFLFTFGVWANLYIIYSITPRLILAACILSYSGFILGAFSAWALRQPLNRIVAIAIETGVQNTGLPILLLKFSLPQPEADLSVVASVTVAMLMPLPLWIVIFALEIRKCMQKRNKKEAKQPMLDTPPELMEQHISSIDQHSASNGTAMAKKDSALSENLTDSTLLNHDIANLI